MTGTFTIPNVVFDDKYFDEDRPLSRRERLAWIAKHVRWTDNCVLRRGQGAWSIRYLAEAWKCPRSTVDRFLKKLESLGLIAVSKRIVSGTAQLVITYCFSKTYNDDETVSGTAAGQQRDSSGTKTKSGNSGKSKKEDSRGAEEPHVCDGTFAGEPVDGAEPEAASSSRAAGEEEPTPNSAPPPSAAYPPEFELFWSTCPKRVGAQGSKSGVYEKWKRYSLAEREKILAGAKLWAKRDSVKTKHVPMIQTWFNGKRWETEAEVGAKQARPGAFINEEGAECGVMY